jgi:cytochrome b
MPPTPEAASAKSLRVWDLPTRVFHWVLLTLVVFCVVSAKIGGNWTPWHMRAGYAVLALVAFRIVWGFIGSDTARFTHFVRSPFAVFRYFRDSWRGKAGAEVGHNPAGAYSVLLLLTVLFVQAVTGLFIDDEIANQGPLYAKVSSDVVSWATRIHHWNEKVLYGVVGIHVVAILVYVFGKRETLVKPMLTGDKPWPTAVPHPALRFAPTWLALVILGICAAAVYGLVVIYPKA